MDKQSADRLAQARKDVTEINKLYKEMGSGKVFPMPAKDAELTTRELEKINREYDKACLLYTSPSPRDRQKSRMPSSA